MTTTAAPWSDLLEGDDLAYLTTEPPREARTAPLPDDLAPALREALPFDSLYEHQAEAWEAAQHGEHVIVTTGTASGKSLAFNLPVLDALAREPKLRALYLYPTKALSQDQGRALGAFGVNASGRRSTTATRPPSAAGRSASGRTSSSRTRTCCT
jgi:DEAD/DEAH box helicase domain-containing protein